MAKHKDFGSVVFTSSVSFQTGLKIYELVDKLGCSTNKVMQELITYAADRAYIGRASKDVEKIMFKEIAD